MLRTFHNCIWEFYISHRNKKSTMQQWVSGNMFIFYLSVYIIHLFRHLQIPVSPLIVHSGWCGHRPLLISVVVYFYMLINNLFHMKGVRLNLLPIKLYSRMIEISWQYFSFLACWELRRRMSFFPAKGLLCFSVLSWLSVRTIDYGPHTGVAGRRLPV